MLLWLHRLLALATIARVLGVAVLGWRYRLTRAAGSGGLHARWGKRLLVLLALVWLAGLTSVILANRAGAAPASSGHFIGACIILAGYSLSAFLMLTRGRNKWVRRLHVAA